MGKKKRQEQEKENSFIAGVLKPLGIALLIGIGAALFLWGLESSMIVPILLILVKWVGFLGLGGLLIYYFFSIIKGMRKGESYTVFHANTPLKRFFEYVFISIFTCGLGFFFIALVIWEMITLLKEYAYGGW
jgi:hypothetical protein